MRIPRRHVEDHDVDRLGVDARQRVELTSTNRPFGLANVGNSRVVDRQSVLSPSRLAWRRVESKVSSGTLNRSVFENRWCGARARARERCRPRAHRFSGDYCGGATPDPIPNSEVKPSSADGTAGVTLWESRSLPDLWAGSLRGTGPSFLVQVSGAHTRGRARRDRAAPVARATAPYASTRLKLAFATRLPLTCSSTRCLPG